MEPEPKLEGPESEIKAHNNHQATFLAEMRL